MRADTKRHGQSQEISKVQANEYDLICVNSN
jgi:hypothetical protein